VEVLSPEAGDLHTLMTYAVFLRSEEEDIHG